VAGELVDAVVGDAIGGHTHLLEAVLREVEMGLFGEKKRIDRHG
jgi:hypothetical protein